MKPHNLLSIFCLAVLCLVGLPPALSQDAWTSLPPMPNPAGFFSAVPYGGKIYLFGGASPDHTVATNKVFAFDPSDNSYTAMPDMPVAMTCMGVVEVGGKIYVMGGANAVTGSTMYNTNYIFDPEQKVWETGPPMPHPRQLFAIAAAKKKIYIMGGGIVNTVPTKLVDVFDTETKTWSAGVDLPFAKGFLTAAEVEDKIYVFGGTVDAFGIGLSAVDIFDPATGIWTSGKPLPTKRLGAVAAEQDGKIYVLGGSSLDAPNPWFKTVEKYDPQTNIWETLPSMLTGARGRAAAVVNGNLYAFGGIYTYTTAGLATNAAEVLEISSSLTQLSEGKCRMGAAALGNKAYYAGGNSYPTTHLAKVEIYDVETRAWSFANLSQARAYTSGASAGTKVLFAGGGNFLTNTVYATVDIFDTLTNQWTTAQLSTPRFDCATASADGKALFAGGATLPLAPSKVVDIYNASTNGWSVAQLSEARYNMGSAVAETPLGKVAFFAGGRLADGSPSDRIDLYHFATNTWTTATLPEARLMVSCAAVGGKVLFAGGMTAANQPTDRVDIFDIATAQWSTAQLSEARCTRENGVTACGKVYFAGGGVLNINTNGWLSASDRVDIYDPATGLWSVEDLSNPVVNHSVLAIGKRVLVAGGWDLVSPFFKNLEIFECTTSAVGDLPGLAGTISVFPNPANERVNFLFENAVSGKMILVRPDGAIVFSKNFKNENRLEVPVSGLPGGVFFWKFLDEKGGAAAGKVVIAN